MSEALLLWALGRLYVLDDLVHRKIDRVLRRLDDVRRRQL
jgi:hypothetical protein